MTANGHQNLARRDLFTIPDETLCRKTGFVCDSPSGCKLSSHVATYVRRLDQPHSHLGRRPFRLGQFVEWMQDHPLRPIVMIHSPDSHQENDQHKDRCLWFFGLTNQQKTYCRQKSNSTPEIRHITKLLTEKDPARKAHEQNQHRKLREVKTLS